MRIYNIFIVSDATGKTATFLVKSIIVQFKGMEDSFVLTHFSFVRKKKKIEEIVESAKKNNAMIVHSFGDLELRHYMNSLIDKENIISLDVFKATIPQFIRFTGKQPSGKPGGQYILTETYFKKIEAMEFTITHDDGQNLHDINRADVVILGPSRTSKTPLSIYLANEGYKVANVPIVYNIPLPQEVFSVDRKKIVGLILNYDIMIEIRKKRSNYLGDDSLKYSDPQYVYNELEYCRELYKKHRWRVIDVTKKAVEETATEVLNIVLGEEREFV